VQFPLTRIHPQGRSSSLFQSEDQSWQWQSPVTNRPTVQEPRPICPTTHSPAQHPPSGTAPHRRGIDLPINLKQKLSPPLRPSSQGHHHDQLHDSYSQDPGSWPSSSQHMRPSHQRGRTNSASTLPISFATTDRPVPYISSAMRRTSFLTYPGNYGPDNEDQCRAGSCSSVPENEDGGVAKYDDINMHYDDPNNRPSFYHYPRPTEPRSAPAPAPASFNARGYR
jgi:hypothetical protein